MSDPWSDEARAAKARLEALPALAPIPVLTPDRGDINDAIDEALKQSGGKGGPTGKVGMCFALAVVGGNAADEHATEAQEASLRLELVVSPELNASDIGHQLVPLEVFWLAIKQLISWDRGAGKQKLRFLNWDMVITKKEVTVSADFALFHVLDL
jgi:hypothetical protein